MPLLQRKPFVKENFPEDIKPNEEVFFCPLTKEIFRDYDSFFNRTILLNSLVWSCSVTGRSGLTFEEALESEKNAQESLESFPEGLEKPLSCVIELTYRGRLDDLVSDVWTIMKDRYFVNEEVEVFSKKSRRLARVTAVNYSEPSVKTESDESISPPEPENKLPNGIDVQKSGKRLKEDLRAPNASLFTYDVEFLPDEDEDSDSEEDEEENGTSTTAEDLKHTSLFRPKGSVTKGKLKLFVKNSCEISADRWALKPELSLEHDVTGTDWGEIFAGPKPIFPKTPMSKRASNAAAAAQAAPATPDSTNTDKKTPKSAKNSHKQQQTTPESAGSGSEPKKKEQDSSSTASDKKKPKKPKKPTKSELKKLEDERLRLEEEQRIKRLKEKQDIERLGLLNAARTALRIAGQPTEDLSRFEKLPQNRILTMEEMAELRVLVKKAKQMEKEKLQEVRRKEKEALIEWKRPRDDLECDDLKPLPVAVPLCLPPWMSEDMFGETISLLEFYRCFDHVLELKDNFRPTTPTLEMLLESLVSKESESSVFIDLITALLEVWSAKQTEEDGDEANLEDDSQLDTLELDNRLYSTWIRGATTVSEHIRTIHGMSVRKLHKDALTVTEVVRLFLSVGGYYTGQTTAKFRHHNRGWYRCWDDHTLLMKMSNPSLMDKLAKESILELNPSDRLELLCLIRDQLLTFFAFRDFYESKQEDLRQLKIDYKILEKNDEKAEKDAKAAKLEIRYLERLAEVRAETEAEEKESGSSNKGTTDGKSLLDQEMPTRPKPSKKTKKLLSWLQSNFPSEDPQDAAAVLNSSTRRGSNLGTEFTNLASDSVAFRELEQKEIDLVRVIQRAVLQSEQERTADDIFQTQTAIGWAFIGRDRAFRRYWYSDGLSALLIEEGDTTLGECMEATPMSKVPNKPDLDDLPLKDFNPDIIDAKLRQERLACSGMLSTCLVHGLARTNRSRWSIVTSKEFLTNLESSLNERGFRESELLDNLRAIRPTLESATDSVCERISAHEGDTQTGIFGTFATCLSEIDVFNLPRPDWGFQVRDLLLETEEKISIGGLGALKVRDRSTWRTSLATEKGFNPQISELNVGDDVVHLKESELRNMDPVMETAVALVQIAQSVHLKFLKDPFIDDDEDEENNDQDDEDRNSGPVHSSSFEMWQSSLLESTSYFQVAVHLSSLEPAISWKKSKLLAKCRYCRKKGAPDSTVLCDSCDKAYHIFCVKPKLKQVPEKEWVCTDCRQVERERRAREEKKRKEEERRLNQEEESESSEDVYDDEMDQDQGAEESCMECAKTTNSKTRLECKDCSVVVHLRCAGYKQRPRTWKCAECKAETSEDDDEALTRTKTGRVVRKKKTYEEEVNQQELGRRSSGRSSRRTSGRNSPVINGYGDSGATRGSKRKRGGEELSEEDLRSLSMGLRRKGAGLDNDEYRKAQDIIEDTRRQDDAVPFLTPVDKKEVPDYYLVIKTPMDLRTMLNKLKQRHYESVEEIVADAKLIFHNCRTFNEEHAEVYQCGDRLEEYMMDKFRAAKMIPTSSTSTDNKRRRTTR